MQLEKRSIVATRSKVINPEKQYNLMCGTFRYMYLTISDIMHMQLQAVSLHEGAGFSIHSLNHTGSVAVYFITWTTRQALARPAR